MLRCHGKMPFGIALFARIAHDRRAVTALEYGLLTALIALLIAGSVTLFGNNASSTFSYLANTI